jgi:hypothetical protein
MLFSVIGIDGIKSENNQLNVSASNLKNTLAEISKKLKQASTNKTSSLVIPMNFHLANCSINGYVRYVFKPYGVFGIASQGNKMENLPQNIHPHKAPIHHKSFKQAV